MVLNLVHFFILKRETCVKYSNVSIYNNAPAHTALSIQEILAKKNIPVLPHPPYSPDLALCDFYLFPRLKSKLKGHHFGTMENTKNCN